MLCLDATPRSPRSRLASPWPSHARVNKVCTGGCYLIRAGEAASEQLLLRARTHRLAMFLLCCRWRPPSRSRWRDALTCWRRRANQESARRTPLQGAQSDSEKGLTTSCSSVEVESKVKGAHVTKDRFLKALSDRRLLNPWLFNSNSSLGWYSPGG